MRKSTKYILSAFAAGTLLAGTVVAQTFEIKLGNIIYSIDPSQAGLMTYENGQTLTVQGHTVNLSEITGMQVTADDPVEDNTVEVVYNGDLVQVKVAGNIAQYIDIETDGAYVTLTQKDGVGDSTGEIIYSLSGESDNGALTLEGSYKCTVELRGLTLTSRKGAAIDIENGKRIELSSKNGTVNSLEDCSGGKQKAALYCKGHLELKGKGVLNVKGNTSHAIAAKEYVEMKNCTVNILGAVKDGINCAQYFLLESGELNISGTGEDGIQTDYKDSSDREKEDTGTIEIEGGKLNVEISGTAAKALKAEGDFIMSGGELTSVTSGAGDWDSSKLKTKASSCISADGNVEIGGGTLNLTATGGGGKGISCEGQLTINSGNLTITTTGGVLAYVNGSLNQNYTGNTDRLDSDYKSSPKGIKCDGEVEINGGAIDIKTTGHGGEGIESKSILTINDGTVSVRAYDDAINSSSHMYIKGGEIDVISTNNDGLDSNGNLYIEGGVIRAFGGNSPECGIDAADEDGFSVIITGGYLLAVGGGNSTPRTSASTQPYVSVSQNVSAGQTVTIASGDKTLYSFDIPSDYTASGSTGGWGPGGNSRGRSVMISVPDLTNGSTYTISNGSDSASGIARLTGNGSNRPGGW